MDEGIKKPYLRKPPWIRFSMPGGKDYVRVRGIIKEEGLHTVCTEAGCPNIGECFSRGTATFLILGDTCTRNCRYCAVNQGTPGPVAVAEPEKIARAVEKLGLTYAVITSVTRDDLPDGGAGIYAELIGKIRDRSPLCEIEVLVPDFMPSWRENLQLVIDARPDVLNHNIEVAGSLYRELRPMGNYDISLEILKAAADAGLPAKSGLMIGFGESTEDIYKTLDDLRGAGCSMLTVGQYLQSTRDGFPVVKYYHPDEFEEIRKKALETGFRKVMSGPLVRSSYHAGELAH